jgi:hypothetical protein
MGKGMHIRKLPAESGKMEEHKQGKKLRLMNWKEHRACGHLEKG